MDVVQHVLLQFPTFHLEWHLRPPRPMNSYRDLNDRININNYARSVNERYGVSTHGCMRVEHSIHLSAVHGGVPAAIPSDECPILHRVSCNLDEKGLISAVLYGYCACLRCFTSSMWCYAKFPTIPWEVSHRWRLPMYSDPSWVNKKWWICIKQFVFVDSYLLVVLTLQGFVLRHAMLSQWERPVLLNPWVSLRSLLVPVEFPGQFANCNQRELKL